LSNISNIADYFTGKRLVIPILIGLATTAYFFLQDFDMQAYSSISWTVTTSFWIGVAVLSVFIRLMCYAYRLIVLSNYELSWLRAIQIIVLWEFSSAISPGIVGGTAAALLLLAREKNINSGKGTAMVLATSFLDVLFYVLAVPFIALWVNRADTIPANIGYLTEAIIWRYFIVIYFVFLSWAILLGFGLFFKPNSITRLALLFTRIPFLSRYTERVKNWSGNVLIAAEAFRKESFWHWTKAFGGTTLAWVSRFILVNCLILALGNGTATAEIFGKQLVMWAALMIPATPGAAGMAEWLFTGFMSEYFVNAQLTNTTAFLWRLMSYWPYLFAGFILFPVWYKTIQRTSNMQKEISKR
jgi:glycosyltransferase 2 family protein